MIGWSYKWHAALLTIHSIAADVGLFDVEVTNEYALRPNILQLLRAQ